MKNQYHNIASSLNKNYFKGSPKIKEGILSFRKIGWSILLLLFLTANANAATITSTATGGAWETGSTWVGGVSPAATDIVIIATTGVNTVTGIKSGTSYTCAGLTINTGAILTMNRPFTVNGNTLISGTINLGSTSGTARAIKFTGDVTLNSSAIWIEPSTGNGSTNTYNFGGNFTNNATTFAGLGTGINTFSGTAKTISGSSITSIPSVAITGTYTNNGTLTVGTALSGTGTLTQDTTGVLNIGGTSTITSLVATATGNNVNYTGVAQTVFLTTYNNLALAGTGVKTFPTGTTTVNGILSIENGANANVFTGTLAYGSAATLQYNTTSARTAGAEWLATTVATGGVIVKNTGVITMNGTKTFNATTPLSISSGSTLAMSTFLLTLNGNFINNGGTTSGSGGVTIAGTATQNIGGFTNTGTVSMTKTGGTATFTGNVNGGALTLNGSGGTLDLGAGFTHTFSGVWTRSNGALLGNSSTLNIGGSVTNTAGTFTAGTSTINYNGTGQTIANVTYNNLVLSGSGVKIFPSITTINGDIAFLGTAVANLGGFISSSATLTVLGVKQSLGSWGGTGSGAAHINATFFGATTGILNVSSSCVLGTWNGSTSTDWNTASNWCNSIVPTSSTNVIIPSGGNQPVIGSAGGVCNDIIINSSATLAITGTNVLDVSGNWTNNGTFTPNTSTVTFNSSVFNQTINGTGTQTFYNLTSVKGTTSLVLSQATTIGGTLTMTSGNIDASSNTLTLGTSIATTGTLTYTSGNIIGCFTRWINATGTAIKFPVGTATNNNMAEVNFTNLTSGSLTACFTPTDSGWNTTPPLFENSVQIDRQFPEGYWTLTAANSLASTNYLLKLTGNGFVTYTEDNTVRIIQRANGAANWVLNGTHDITGYTSPTAHRIGLNLFGQFAHARIKPCILSATVVQTNATCGNSNGTITVSPSGATNYQFSTDNSTWTNTTGNFTGLSAGSYTIYLRDADATSCSIVVGTYIITQPVLALSSVVTDVTCSANGSINITASGGSLPYTYDWADLPGTNNGEDRTGLLAGTYSVIFTDANGCTFSSGPIVVASPVGGCTGVDVCKSDAAKVFSVTPNPDVTSYNWIVPSGATIVSGLGTSSITVNFTGVAIGTYQVKVSTTNTCSTSSETLLTVYVNAPVATAQVIGSLCVGGNIQLSAGGGQTYSWSGPNGFISSSANPLIYNASAANNGTYTVTVTDQKGCSATANVVVTMNTPPTTTVSSIVSESGCGLGDGAININTPTNGAPFTYLWNTGATTQNISGLTAGVYTVTISNSLGCSTSYNYVVGVTGGPTTTIASTTNVSCNGGNNGAININTPTGGTSPYTYLWSNAATTQNITGLSAGTYSVNISDSNGCTSTIDAIVTQPNALQLDKIITNINCNGASTGAINITATGGTAPYTYNWGGGIISEDRSAIPAGSYAVTVTDAKLCTIIGSYTITQPAVALSASTTVTNINCYNAANGIVNLTITGGTAPYTYLWSNAATTQNITGLSPNTYTVTITDAKGCTTTSSGIVSQPAQLSLSTSNTNVSCFGGANGGIILTVSGGTSPFTYSWSNGLTTKDLSGLLAATYSVIVTDAHGCSATISTTITEPNVLSASAVASPALCKGGATGSIALTVNGGTSGYTYLWSNTATTQNLTNVSAGFYSVTITDSKGCTTTSSATVTEPSAIAVAASVTNILCNGGTTGAINITATGGTGTYTYNWGGGITIEDRTGLSAGTYSVTVTDGNSCNSVLTSFTITESPLLSLSATPKNVLCKGSSDGNINLSVTGGTFPYTYSWTGSNSFSATTDNLDNIPAGTYSVTVTDANSCSKSISSIIISEPSSILSVIATPTAATCLGGSNGSITASASGGTAPYSYSWSNGATSATISGLTAGTYTVLATDANGCSTTSYSAIVSQPATQMQLYATTIQSSSCGTATGSVNLTVVNGNSPFNYSWTNTSQTIQNPTGLAADTYTVTVTDNTGCSATLPVTIDSAPALSVSITTYPKTCLYNDGTAYAIVSGGVQPYTYLWSNAATTQDIGFLDAGAVTVTVTDANGCTAFISGTVGSISCLPPVALTDVFTTNYNTILNNTVATNDSDPDGDNSKLQFFNTSIPTPAQGTLTWGTNYDGTFTFTPTIGYAGTFTLTYKVFDVTGLSTIGTYTITVGPDAVNDAIGTSLNTAVLGNVATNDIYEAGSSFTKLTDPIQGSVVFNSDGTYTYTPNNGAIGDDSFTYQVCLPTPNTGICSTATVLISIDGSADMSMTKTVNNATPNVGSNVVFTLTATNSGPNVALGVSVTDVLPTGYTYVSNTTPSAGSFDSSTGIWTIGSVANAASETLTITAKVNATGNYSNSATVSSPSTDPAPGNNTSIVSTTPVPQSDLSIVKTADNPSQNVGGLITFTLAVTNNGPSNAAGIVVNDLLPNGYTYVSNDGGGTYIPGTGVWTIGSLANGLTTNLNITATVNGSGTYTNTAIISSTTADPTSANNSSTVTPVPGAVSDLKIIKTVSNSTPYTGEIVEFTLVATNQGPSNATGVVVTDVLPSGYTYVSDNGGAATTESSGTVTWAIGDIADLATATLKITAKVNASGTYSNTATIVTPNQPDSNSSDNTSSVLTTPVPQADLTITKTVDNSTPLKGSNVLFSIVVTNNGVSDATGVNVLDSLPTGYTYVSDNGVGAYVPGTGIWTIGNLANGATATLAVTATVNASGNYMNTASVSSNTSDLTSWNNSSTKTVSPVLCSLTTPVASVTIQPTCGTPSGTIVFTTQTGVEYSIDGTNYQASETFAGVAAGSYTPKVRSTSDNTCTTTGTAVIVNAIPSAPATPVASVTIQPTCGTPSGTIVFTTQTGVEYSIDGTNYQASETFAGVAAGSYTPKVRSTSDNTCTTTGTAVTVNAIPSAPATPVASVTIQPTCGTPSGTIVFTTQTGVEYSIDGTNYQASETFAGVAAGSYTPKVRSTSDNTCTTTGTAVTVNAIPSAPATPVASVTIQPTCGTPSGTIVFTTQTGVEYSIDGTNYQASETFAGVAAGSYTPKVRSTSDNTCTTTGIAVTVNAIPSAPATPVASVTIQPTCGTPSGTIVFTTQTGVEYSIDGTNYQASETFAGVAAGSYTPKVRSTSDNTCTTTGIAVTVNNIICTNNDTPTSINGYTGGTTASVLDNDTLNAVTVIPSEVNLTEVTVPTGLTLNADGTITVAAQTPAGTYTVIYSICEKLNPTNCSQGTSSVVVTKAVIAAVNDTPTSINGYTGGTTASVLDNDTLNAVTVIPSEVNLTGVTVPTGLTLNADGTITVAPQTPAGTYTVTYSICEKLNPTNCSQGTSSVVVTKAVIAAVNDTPASINGYAGATTASVLDNDTLNAVTVIPSEVNLTGVTVPTGLTLNADGTITVAPQTPAGTYTVTYSICEKLNPTNCSQGTSSVVVTKAVIAAVNDTPASINGYAGATTASVLDNDTLNAVTVIPSEVNLTGVTVPTGLTLNADGTITVAPQTPAGTYTVTYSICEKLNPTNCSQGTSSVVVTKAVIAAVNDTPTSINGYTGATTASVLDNDTLNAVTVIPSEVNLTGVTVPTGLTLNADGTITVAPQTPAGTYTVTYSICEKLNPTNCSQATSSVVVTKAVIAAVNDTPTSINGYTGATTASVLDNDTLNAVTVIPSEVNLTGVTVPTGLTLNADGTITVAPQTPAGTYTVTYSICEKLNPTNCSQGTSSVVVTKAVIAAVNDTPASINGYTGATTASVLDNDTLNAVTVIPSEVNLTEVTVPTGLTLNADGTITVAPQTPAGTYTVTYSICEKLNPTNCSQATSSVVVTKAVIAANNDTPASINGYTGATTASVLDNDTLNAVTVIPSEVNLTEVTVPTGLTLNADGTITVAPQTPAGTYTVTYSICEKLNPTNCSQATSSVVVTKAVIAANNDTPASINGYTGATTASVLDNDTLNAVAVIPSEVNLTAAATVPTGLTLNTDGTITVAPQTPAGTYTVTYSICEKLNPTNCSQGTSTVTVLAAGLIANQDTAGPINGYIGGDAGINVLTNDTLNGQPIISSEVTIASNTSGPLTVNADGTITVLPNTLGGTYTVSYTVCEKLNPTNCQTSTVTVNIPLGIPSMTLIKTASVSGTGAVGSIITYTFTITNTGNVPLNTIVIDDPLLSAIPIAVPGILVPNAVVTKTATYTITQADVDAGGVTNTATASGFDPNGNKISRVSDNGDPSDGNNNPTVSKLTQLPSIAVITTASFDDNNGDGFAQAGETVTYRFTVTNTGNVTLTNITIPNNILGLVVTGGPITLGVGKSDSTTFTASYVLTQADIILGTITNQATAVGTSPDGGTVQDISDDLNNSNNNPTVLSITGCVIEVFNAVSPNNDGNNDVFYIRGLECYPDNSVEIFNRWGVMVFERDQYNNTDRAFKGVSEGRVTVNQSEELPDGTYYYVFKYKDFAGNAHQKAGYLYINR